MGIFNADVIINIPPAFFSLQKSGLVRVYLTSVFLLLSVPRCFGDQKPQFDSGTVSSGGEREGVRGRGRERMGRKGMRSDRGVQMKRSRTELHDERRWDQ